VSRCAGSASSSFPPRFSRGRSRSCASTSLVINLPGQPKSIRETLEGLKDKDGKQIVPGIFAAVPYCIDLIGGPYIETREEVVRAFRPKSAIRPKAG